MFDDLRLTELHEEVAAYTEASKREGGMRRMPIDYIREREAAIRRRVAVTKVAHRGPATTAALALLHGTPDAEREYPRPRRSAAPLRSWVNHATHVIPVEGCHLCREGRGFRAGKPFDARPGETYVSPEAMVILRAMAGVP